MATALDIIKRSMRLIGALGGGETPTADEATDGMTALNAMLDMWDIQRLAVYQIQQEAFTWASGNASRTIGSGGDFNATNPTRVESAVQTVNSIDYPINILKQEQYRNLPDKTTQTDLITHIWHEYAPTLSTLYAYPVPSANAAVKLRTWKQLQSFAALTDVLTLPKGYEDAITYNLAVQLAPEYQRAIPTQVGMYAMSSLRVLKTHNLEVPTMTVEPAHVSDPAYFDWRTG